MPRIAYVNGRFVRHDDAAVHIEDRGYQFADGVYEVIPVLGDLLLDEEGHLDRLQRSLAELRIALPKPRAVIRQLSREIIRRNSVDQGYLYLQITRGVAPRDHCFPVPAPKPALVITARHLGSPPREIFERGVSVITRKDIRWKRRDIKSISLLPNVLAKQEAVESQAYETWQVDEEGFVTEGASTNAWIVTEGGILVTRPASADILNGVTRQGVLAVARKAGYALEERRFSVAEARDAQEAFLTASSLHVLPVTQLDGKPIGDGEVGELSRRLCADYVSWVTARAT